MSRRLAEKLLHSDLIVIDELDYLPFSQPDGQLLFQGHSVPDAMSILKRAASTSGWPDAPSNTARQTRARLVMRAVL